MTLTQKGGRYGSLTPFAEPLWYRTGESPYYDQTHISFRARVRDFMEGYVIPNTDQWEKEGLIPRAFFTKAYAAGCYAPMFPEAIGGTPPEGGNYDAFHDLIWLDELARCGSGGIVSAFTIYTMALPPILMVGSDYIREKVVTPVLTGEKILSLAISEPYAGSDVAGMRATAVLDGDHYVLNGEKKWITLSFYADLFTVACRTGADGRGGISILLVERGMPGVEVDRMPLQGHLTAGTSMVTFSDVRVPVANLVGKENEGFKVLMQNFNHERLSIAVQANRMSRICIQESIEYARKRKVFGQRLVDSQVIRHKIADMAMKVDAHWAQCEAVCFQMRAGTPSSDLAAEMAMLKVLGSRTFELCAREAAQIFGGASYVRAGQGAMVERLYREVRSTAIPGGSEEIMLDLAMRQARL
jgi:alkylation response protein AidB-like acyl-CoA dehydrogenase